MYFIINIETKTVCNHNLSFRMARDLIKALRTNFPGVEYKLLQEIKENDL